MANLLDEQLPSLLINRCDFSLGAVLGYEIYALDPAFDTPIPILKLERARNNLASQKLRRLIVVGLALIRRFQH